MLWFLSGTLLNLQINLGSWYLTMFSLPIHNTTHVSISLGLWFISSAFLRFQHIESIHFVRFITKYVFWSCDKNGIVFNFGFQCFHCEYTEMQLFFVGWFCILWPCLNSLVSSSFVCVGVGVVCGSLWIFCVDNCATIITSFQSVCLLLSFAFLNW